MCKLSTKQWIICSVISVVTILVGIIATALLIVFLVVPQSTGSDDLSTPWTCLDSVANQGVPGNCPIRRNPAGQIECQSYNAKNCLWGPKCEDQLPGLIEDPKLKPLVCGEMHKKFYGITGYDRPAHWCSKAKAYFEDQ